MQLEASASLRLTHVLRGLAHEAHASLGATTQTYQKVKSIVPPRTRPEERVWLRRTSHPTYLALFPESMRSWMSL